jgi:hypothetical protein
MGSSLGSEDFIAGARHSPAPSPPRGDSDPEESRFDASGEDDFTFFRRRPHERTRIRSPFPGEFPRKILKQHRGRTAVVIVAVDRDPVTGDPRNRARGVLFVEGGRA